MIRTTLIGISIVLSGCVFTDVKTRVSTEEMSHLRGVNQDDNTAILQIAGLIKDGELEKKTGLSLAKLVYREGRDAMDIQPSEAGNIGMQYLRMVGRERATEQLKTGFEWTTKAIAQAAGAGTGTGGLMATIGLLIRSRNKKNKALGIVKSELTPDELAKVKKAAEHTGLEREIT